MITGVSIEVGAGDLDYAIKVYEASMEPACTDDILDWISDLVAVSARSKRSGDEQKRMLKQFVGWLIEYPEDVVRDVLQNWPRRSPYFPNAWHDLQVQLDKACEERIAIYSELKCLEMKITAP